MPTLACTMAGIYGCGLGMSFLPFCQCHPRGGTCVAWDLWAKSLWDLCFADPSIFLPFLLDKKSRISYAECRAFRRSQRTNFAQAERRVELARTMLRQSKISEAKESRPTSRAHRTRRTVGEPVEPRPSPMLAVACAPNPEKICLYYGSINLTVHPVGTMPSLLHLASLFL